LSNRWWDYTQTYGARSHHGYVKGFPYPKGQARFLATWRRAAGERSRFHAQAAPRFLRHRIRPDEPIVAATGQGEQNDEYSAALAFAANEFQVNHWNALEPRPRASLVVPYEDPEASRVAKFAVAPAIGVSRKC
jgi:hypothetical protein